MNYIDLSRAPTSADSSTSITDSGGASGSQIADISAERDRLQGQLNDAVDSISSLRLQLQSLREQLAAETQKRFEAERAVSDAKETPAQSLSEGQVATQDSVQKTSGGGAEPDSSLFVKTEEPTSQAAAPASSGADGAHTDGNSTSDINEFQQLIESSADRSASQATANHDGEAQPGPSAASPSAEPAPLKPRQEAAVSQAMSRAGLEELTADARETLKTNLTDGKCVTSSLEDVFGTPVPVVPLRNLLRDLNSDC